MLSHNLCNLLIWCVVIKIRQIKELREAFTLKASWEEEHMKCVMIGLLILHLSLSEILIKNLKNVFFFLPLCKNKTKKNANE